MSEQPTKEGTIPFTIPSIETPCSTYYKVVGDLSCGVPPVVMLHGLASGHEYLLPFADLWPRYGVPVVFYDQIGCGASTHLRETAGDKSFWTEDVFLAELNNLLDHLQLRDGPGFHIFGNSWGGMFGASFASSRPRGLQRLVLASALASGELGNRGLQLLREQLSSEDQATLQKAEQDDAWDTPAAQNVMLTFTRKHGCRTDPPPPEMMSIMKNMSDDPTVYRTMFGPAWLAYTGSLVDWTCIPRLPLITAPTLVYNGEYDSCHDVATKPFFELIPRVRWITFTNAGHATHLEDGVREKVFNAVGEFLVQK